MQMDFEVKDAPRLLDPAVGGAAARVLDGKDRREGDVSGGGDGGGACAGDGAEESEVSAGSPGAAEEDWSSWSIEEQEKLLLSIAKIFQIQFPLYTAYKHNTHTTIEARRACDAWPFNSAVSHLRGFENVLK